MRSQEFMVVSVVTYTVLFHMFSTFVENEHTPPLISPQEVLRWRVVGVSNRSEQSLEGRAEPQSNTHVWGEWLVLLRNISQFLSESYREEKQSSRIVV